MKSKKRRKTVVYRSAVTGKFVSARKAAKSPRTTVKETTRRRKSK